MYRGTRPAPCPGLAAKPRGGQTGRVSKAESLSAWWRRARESLGLPPDAPLPDAWHFGDSPAMADRLLALVLAGTKTATAGALCEYEARSEPLPAVGTYSIVLDGAGAPACVIETTEVRIVPMSEVDAQHAFDEGEGDRTLASWREAHEGFFRRFLPTIGLAFSPDMPLVLERFAVRHR
jgi:uncharacterized protein YhfF